MEDISNDQEQCMANLGKIHKIADLREIWPNEERDFSKWLARPENLK